MTYYKLLNVDGTTCNGGSGLWYLPHGKRPGKWMPPIKNIKLCRRGYHLVPVRHLLDWAGSALFVAEYRGAMIDNGDKIVVEQSRLIRQIPGWNERNLRLLACDFAARVLPIFERSHPDDKRPRKCIEVARRCANGEASSQDLTAARDAARAAAWAAAGDAEHEWQIQRMCEVIGIALD